MGYGIVGIFYITTPDLEICPIAFHSRSLHNAERNYDTHNKELLAVFDCYKAWQHYLEGSGHPINTVTDHKNLEYFTSMKKLTHQQAQWSEYLSQFNLQICFHPGRLGTKPDALTCCSDVHPGSRLDTTPTNVHPLFTPWQLETPTSCTSRLDYPPGGLLETLDQFQILMEVAQHLSSDTFAQMVKKRLRDQHSLPGWEWKDERLWYKGHIYVPKPLCLQLIRNHHDHPMVGHFGHRKTIDLLHQSCHWLGLTQMVKQYIQSCMVCACSKANWHKPYGFLKQLPIPPQPWESISMDFIEQLLASEGHMAILVIVDHLTKQSLFIPTHDSINSLELAQLFLTHMFSKHGMPSHVTSDWGSEFVSHFFQSLSKLLWMELHFMSGYHPEGDGQTERLNQVLEQYRRAYTNYQQDDWSSLLPLAEFAYNNAMNEMTGVSPFFANKGSHPSFVAELNEQVSSQKHNTSYWTWMTYTQSITKAQ